MAEPIRVLVADDHPLLLEGVLATLRAADDFSVVGSATDAVGATRLAATQRPDIAVLDVTMPGGGLSAARDIVAVSPNTRIVECFGLTPR